MRSCGNNTVATRWVASAITLGNVLMRVLRGTDLAVAEELHHDPGIDDVLGPVVGCPTPCLLPSGMAMLGEAALPTGACASSGMRG